VCDGQGKGALQVSHVLVKQDDASRLLRLEPYVWEPSDRREEEPEPTPAHYVSRQLLNAAVHFREPTTRQGDTPGERFRTLARRWRDETVHLSSTSAIAAHPAYQQIIGMGRVALPFILRELEEQGGHWFWALKAITGIDPVPSEQRGRIQTMKQAWLRWGREQGLR
jgi:hypothetical protein